MINDSKMQAFENIIVEHAGPLGKFVIKKTLTDMGADPYNLDENTLSQFIDTVLERSIYDPSKWKAVRLEIFETCQFPGKP